MKLLCTSLFLATTAYSRLLEQTNPAVTCPEVAPENGIECPVLGMYCSWGDDPRYSCRKHAQCMKDYTNISAPYYWKVDGGTCGVTYETISDTSGDACTSVIDGVICETDGILCSNNDGSYCICTHMSTYPCYPTCSITPETRWQCIPPMNNDPSCPLVAPNAGTPCSGSSSCFYTCEHIFNCVNGIWFYREGNCPKCAAPNTLITTSSGSVPISDLKLGDLVLSVDKNGQKTVVPIVDLSKFPVYNHHAVKVILENDATLFMSPGHPTADGRIFNDLKYGDYLHNIKITSVEIVSYPFDHTYDILPQSDTGFYFAEDILIGSTLYSGTPPVISFT